MGLMVDTSILVAAERGYFDWDKLVLHFGVEYPFIAAITLSELWHGCHRGKGPILQRRLEFVRKVEGLIPVLSFSAKEALIHARIWANLEKIGQKIGDHDLLIAATALSHDYPLATLNENEFRRVPGLQLKSLKQFAAK